MIAFFAWIAAIVIAFVGIPQLIHIWRFRYAGAISLTTYALLVTCQACLFLYALSIGGYVFMLTNGAGCVVNSLVLVSIVTHRGETSRRT